MNATVRPGGAGERRADVDAEVVIAGASFAGLATARALQGRDVLIVDPHPPGAFETSAGGVPYATLEALDAADSARELHHELVLHTARSRRAVALPSPFAVIDYATLCRRLARQSGARIVRRRAVGFADGTVHTDGGPIRCRAAVDASGHRAVLARSVRPRFVARSAMGAGVEVVVRRPRGFPAGLHVHLAGGGPPGYGWAFGAGDVVRVGVGTLSAKRDGHRLERALQTVLERTRLASAGSPLARHGGLIPLKPRSVLIGDLFVVGDAAGQVLPGTAEGIRPALHFGAHLGSALADALAGRSTLDEARRRYVELAARHDRAYRELALVQRFLTAFPPSLVGPLLLAAARPRLATSGMARYMRAFDVPPLPPPWREEEAAEPLVACARRCCAARQRRAAPRASATTVTIGAPPGNSS